MIPEKRRARWLMGLLVALILPLALAGTSSASEQSDARKAAKRAGHLAEKGKCKQAVIQYNKAIPVLHDPTLFFNRGECHRRLGNNEAALADYNQFLADLPKAPNRAEVERRIAELNKAMTATARSMAAASPVEETEPDETPAVPAPARREAAPPVAPAKAVALATPPAGGVADAGNRSLLSNTEPAAAPAATGEGRMSSRPWFWIAVGAAVVGAGTTAYFLLSRDPTPVPASALGNYKF